jgi:hypothetical protein
MKCNKSGDNDLLFFVLMALVLLAFVGLVLLCSGGFAFMILNTGDFITPDGADPALIAMAGLLMLGIGGIPLVLYFAISGRHDRWKVVAVRDEEGYEDLIYYKLA